MPIDIELGDGGARHLRVVLTGVSVNLALPLAAGDLTHERFAVVIPTDAVGGTPADYARQALRHTLRCWPR